MADKIDIIVMNPDDIVVSVKEENKPIVRVISEGGIGGGGYQFSIEDDHILVGNLNIEDDHIIVI